MKVSGKKVFGKLQTYFNLLLFFFTILTLFVAEYTLSNYKIKDLEEQKTIVRELQNSITLEPNLALVKFEAKVTQLNNRVSHLQQLYKYNYLEQYLLKNNDIYLSELEALSKIIFIMNANAHIYLNKRMEHRNGSTQPLQLALKDILQKIDTILLKHISYDYQKLNILTIFVFTLYGMVFITTLFFKSRLSNIYKDIKILASVGSSHDKQHREFFSNEAVTIASKFQKQSSSSVDMIDPVTGVKNYKGLLADYTNKKDAMKNNFISIAVLEVDELSTEKEDCSQETFNAIMKKVAFTISLFTQPIDIVARTNMNQFMLILSRPQREQGYKTVEHIRENIAELQIEHLESCITNLTITGGYMIKDHEIALEEAITQAKKIKNYAKSTGRNKILQTRDMKYQESE